MVIGALNLFGGPEITHPGILSSRWFEADLERQKSWIRQNWTIVVQRIEFQMKKEICFLGVFEENLIKGEFIGTSVHLSFFE